jgi:hypothetical protein
MIMNRNVVSPIDFDLGVKIRTAGFVSRPLAGSN